LEVEWDYGPGRGGEQEQPLQVRWETVPLPSVPAHAYLTRPPPAHHASAHAVTPPGAGPGPDEVYAWWRRLGERAWEGGCVRLVELSLHAERTRALVLAVAPPSPLASAPPSPPPSASPVPASRPPHARGEACAETHGLGASERVDEGCGERRGHVTSLFFGASGDAARLAHWRSACRSVRASLGLLFGADIEGGGGGGVEGEGDELVRVWRGGWGGWRALRTPVPRLADRVLPPSRVFCVCVVACARMWCVVACARLPACARLLLASLLASLLVSARQPPLCVPHPLHTRAGASGTHTHPWLGRYDKVAMGVGKGG